MNNFNTVQNQDTIKINKSPADKKNIYTVINLEALKEAVNDLNTSAFKLYIYLAKNQNNYTMALSRKAFLQWSGIKNKDTYFNAKHKLIEKGYLIQDKNNEHLYNFYEVKQPKKQDTNNN